MSPLVRAGGKQRPWGEGRKKNPVFCESKKLKETFREEFEDVGDFGDDKA